MSTEAARNESINRPIQNRPTEVIASDRLLLDIANSSKSNSANSANPGSEMNIEGLGDFTFAVNENPSEGDADKIFGALAEAAENLPQPEETGEGNPFGPADNLSQTKNTSSMPTKAIQNSANLSRLHRFIYNPALEQHAVNLAQGLVNASYYVRRFGLNSLNQAQWSVFNNNLRTLHVNMATITNNHTGGNVQPYAASTNYGGNNYTNGGNPYFNNLCRFFANIMGGNPAANNANNNGQPHDPNDLLLSYAGFNQMWTNQGVNGLPYQMTGLR